MILQDFTGVPGRRPRRDARRDGGAGRRPEPDQPARAGRPRDDHPSRSTRSARAAFAANVERDYERNVERYALLRWAQQAFADFRVVPPGTGIVHQVNLEYLAASSPSAQRPRPDTLVGTDSHTTMINGLGVLGWGVGGIEAEAALLGQPLYSRCPGRRLPYPRRDALGTTATDLVLVVTEMLVPMAWSAIRRVLRAGADQLSPCRPGHDRNIAPEYGATAASSRSTTRRSTTCAWTGRPDEVIARVEGYAKAQVPFRTDDSPDPVSASR